MHPTGVRKIKAFWPFSDLKKNKNSFCKGYKNFHFSCKLKASKVFIVRALILLIFVQLLHFSLLQVNLNTATAVTRLMELLEPGKGWLATA